MNLAMGIDDDGNRHTKGPGKDRFHLAVHISMT